jgi:hypothetical protein
VKDEDGIVLNQKIGNSTGPFCQRNCLLGQLKERDKLHVVEHTERSIKLSPYDPKHAKAMEIARRSFRKYADAYKALAK